MKDGLYLKVESVKYESDYWEVSELVAEHKSHYSWTTNKDEAMNYLAKRSKQSFFKDAEVIVK